MDVPPRCGCVTPRAANDFAHPGNLAGRCTHGAAQNRRPTTTYSSRQTASQAPRDGQSSDRLKTILFTLAALIAISAKAEPDFESLPPLFDYDAKQPLGLQDKIIEEFPDGTLHDITYTSPKGGPVDAYLVVPKGKGPFAAILFGHWGNGTRAEFIPEAKIYAKAGAVSLLPDYPWDRAQPWYKSLDHYDKARVGPRHRNSGGDRPAPWNRFAAGPA